jgi:hypothetical protein
MKGTIQTQLLGIDYRERYLQFYYSPNKDSPEGIQAYIDFITNCIDDPDWVKCRLEAYGRVPA